MKEVKNAYRKMIESVPADIKAEIDLSFTLSTLAMLSSFFGQPIITVG